MNTQLSIDCYTKQLNPLADPEQAPHQRDFHVITMQQKAIKYKYLISVYPFYGHWIVHVTMKGHHESLAFHRIVHGIMSGVDM